MRFPRPRATSGVTNPLDEATCRQVVGTFNRSRWVSASSGVNPAAPTGSLVVLAFVMAMSAISVVRERRSRGRHVLSWRRFPTFPRRAGSATEVGMVMKLLLLAAVAGGMSGMIVAATPTHEMVALLLVWMACSFAACLLE